MKFSRIASAAAAIAAAGMMTVAAGAKGVVLVEGGDPGLNSSTNMWLVQIFNVGNEAEKKPATDYGIDLSKVAKLSVTFTIPAEAQEWFEGQTGGGVILSMGGGSLGTSSDYNWPSQQYWGVNDEALGFTAADQTLTAEKVGDYTYKLSTGAFANPIVDGAATADELEYVQAAFQEWGSDLDPVEVLGMEVMDASGNVLISFDSKGKATVGGGSSTPAPSTDGNKNVDTGVEGVAAVVGAAALAAGAVVLTKKRK